MSTHEGSRNPFDGVTDFFSELNRMRELGIHGREPRHEERERTHASAWVPATDIVAIGDDLVVRIELAGIDPEDVALSYAHDVLTVSGTRSAGIGEDPDAVYYVRELYYGAFRRSVTLPEGTRAEQITATFDDGLVEIRVEGAAAAEPGTRITFTDRSDPPVTRRLGG